MFKSGMVAFVGRPNVGKSSLVNLLLDYPLSIVTPKPQTTRDAILGLYNDSDCQLLMMDTPGIHKPEHQLGHRLVERAEAVLQDADLVLYLVAADDRSSHPAHQRILELLRHHHKKVILVLNKIDLPGAKAKVLETMADFHEQLPDAELVPISVAKNENLDRLIQTMKDLTPEGLPLYPEDQLTDRSERFMASEIIRAVAMEGTAEEVPHSLAVQIDEYKSPDEYPDLEKLQVRATVFVERQGQKTILLGKIRTIRIMAQRRLRDATGWPVALDLWVKVSKGWRNSQKDLKRLGYGPIERIDRS